MPKRTRKGQPSAVQKILNASALTSFWIVYALCQSSPVAGFFTHEARVVSRRKIRNRLVVRYFSISDALEAEIATDVDVSALTTSASSRCAPDNSKFPLFPPWLVRQEYSPPESVASEIKWLEFTLLEHRLARDDISDVVKAIYLCAAGDVQMILGIVDFLKLLLQLEETGRIHNMLVTKDVLMASVLHYTECVNARLDGVYQKVEKAMRFEEIPAGVSSPNRLNSVKYIGDQGSEVSCIVGEEAIFPVSAASLRKKLSGHPRQAHGIEFFTPEALQLAASASRIKRAEILADVVLTESRALTTDEYGRVRDLLVSVMEDWRALAIRCVASLYRLEGVLKEIPPGAGDYKKRSFAATLAARNSIRVYANLSQRIGLHRLKTQLEAGAFRILYPRQYSAVSTLFQQKGESMKAISAFLTAQIKKMLREDDFLMEQLESLEISSRVKEPYSFWKKILKKRQQQQRGSSGFLSPSTEISVIDVQDGVALRVILKAAKLSPDESVQTTRRREEMLCYYVHHLIRSRWPATDASRVKDYIRNPKRNGYQSLHHTSSIVRNDQEFPFEVQVRSDEMHRIAEYGVAAHWDYKLGGKPAALLPPSSTHSSEPSDKKKTSKCGRSDYIGALEDARHALVRSNVFVFLGVSSSVPGSGQLLSLPTGAQIIDLFTHLEGTFDLESMHDLQVWRNGQLALLNDVVRNGDVIVLARETPTLSKPDQTQLSSSKPPALEEVLQ